MKYVSYSRRYVINATSASSVASQAETAYTARKPKGIMTFGEEEKKNKRKT